MDAPLCSLCLLLLDDPHFDHAVDPLQILHDGVRRLAANIKDRIRVIAAALIHHSLNVDSAEGNPFLILYWGSLLTHSVPCATAQRIPGWNYDTPIHRCPNIYIATLENQNYISYVL